MKKVREIHNLNLNTALSKQDTISPAPLTKSTWGSHQAQNMMISVSFSESDSPDQVDKLDFESYINSKLYHIENDRYNQTEKIYMSDQKTETSQILSQGVTPRGAVRRLFIDSPIQSPIQVENLLDEDTSNQEVHSQIQNLQQDFAKLSERLNRSEAECDATRIENKRLKHIVDRLEGSVLRIGGTLQDSSIAIEGNKKTLCGDACTIF